MEGFCGRNLSAKEQILYGLQADAALLSETWSTEEEGINLDGFTAYYEKRSTAHVRARRGTGGLAFVVKNEILSRYTVKQLFIDREEVIVLQLTHRLTGFTLTLLGIYLPPETSVYSQDPDQFFESLVSFLYEQCNDDLIVLLGDINARISDKKDYIEGIDDLPPRVNIDEGINDHGKSFINFLLQTNMCVVNGQIDPLQDNFTSVSHRGRAVVDYFAVPNEQLHFVKEFAVIPVNDYVERNQIQHIGSSRISDHSIISCTVDTRSDIENDVSPPQASPEAVATDDAGEGPPPPRRFRKKPIPDEFMSSHDTLMKCSDIIDKLLSDRLTVERLDKLYDELLNVYCNEMSTFLDEIKQTPKSKKVARLT